MLALVLESMQPLGVEEAPGGDIGGERVVLVGVPQAPDHVDELFGAGIARVVVEVVLETEVAADAGVEARDDVPPGATATDVVERGEATSQVERRVVGRAGRADETDVLGVRGDRRQEGQRFEPVEVVRRVGRVDELAVDDEQGVKQGVLGRLRLLDVVVDVDARVVGDAGVLPQAVLAGTADAIRVEGEVDLA